MASVPHMKRHTGQNIYYSALKKAVCDARAASIFCDQL
jgi:hypothetical protein